MKNLFSTLASQFSEFYGKLSPIKRASVIASLFVVFISISFAVYLVSGESYSQLLSNISPEQLPLVVDKLKGKNIPFQLKDKGKSIYIPTELLHSTQMSLMSEFSGVDIGSIGLELFDKQEFGITSYAQKVNYQRALQGELIRAINSIGSIKQSKVILAIPEKKTFLEEEGKASASVTVELFPGKILGPDQVRGIAQLVSSAVDKLDVENVTIVDHKGKVLSKNYANSSGASMELMDIKSKVEGKLEARIESMLAKVLGVGNIIARVDATINTQEISTLEEKVDPDSTALKASTTEEELLDGARTNPTGIPGARANLPGAGDRGEVGFRQNVRKELKQNNYAVPKTVRNIKQAAGGVERLSIAVLVDGVTTTVENENGKEEKWVPRSQEELERYENIIKNAVGFNKERGDTVKVESFKFEKENFEQASKLLTNIEKRKLLHALLKWSLIGFALALFFFVVLRPFISWVSGTLQESVEDLLPRTLEELEELQASEDLLPGMGDALPILEESMDPHKAESELLKGRILKVLEKSEDKATGAFTLWLSRKEI